MSKQQSVEPVEREDIQKTLFDCNYCNEKENIFCQVRNEDLLGSMNAKIWIVGINPHCTSKERECFMQGISSAEEIKEKYFQYWKNRSIHYFDENTEYYGASLCKESNNTNHKIYSHFEEIIEYFNLRDILEFGKNCSYIDLYKIATKNEKELKGLIKRQEKIKECPEKYFLRQIKVGKPKLLIFTGNATKNWFRKKYGKDLDRDKRDMLKLGITKVKLEPIQWIKSEKEHYLLLFCPSFSRNARGAWGKKGSEKRKNFEKVIREYLARH